MLYEPPNRKQYILIGAAAIVLVVLAIVVFSIFHKNKTTQIPADSAAVQEKEKQEKIQEGFKKLDEMKKDETTNVPAPTQADIQKGFEELEKQQPIPESFHPSADQVKAGFDQLEKMKK
jgi:hypothetical protein